MRLILGCNSSNYWESVEIISCVWHIAGVEMIVRGHGEIFFQYLQSWIV